MEMPYPGYQRLIAVNDQPLYLQDDFIGHPDQDLEPKTFVQGGPRTVVYFMDYKIVKGSLYVPVTISSNGDIDPAVKELLLSAEYPMRETTIKTNYALSSWDVTATTNRGFGNYQRLAYDPVGITSLKLSVPNGGPAMLDVEFMGLVASDESAVVPDPNTSGMMRRGITYADCDVHLDDPTHHWDTTREIMIRIENNITPVVIIRRCDSDSFGTDNPERLDMGDSQVWGTIKYSVDRGTLTEERESLPSGGYIGTDMTFDLAGVVKAEFPHVIMKLTEQPLRGTELIERTTTFLSGFDSPVLTADMGGVFEFPSLT